MYFAGVIISCNILSTYFSKYCCCVLPFSQSKMKIRCSLCFLSLHRNFMKTFFPPFLINKTIKSYMTKRNTIYDTANDETNKKLSYNRKYAKAIKKLTKK